jgi:hypothetical protein
MSIIGIQFANAQIAISPEMHKCITRAIEINAVVQGIGSYLQTPSQHGTTVGNMIDEEVKDIENCITNPSSVSALSNETATDNNPNLLH